LIAIFLGILEVAALLTFYSYIDVSKRLGEFGV